MKKLRVLLTGGGSGGHIYPIIAVAQKIKEWAWQNNFQPDLRYFGQAGAYKDILEKEDIKVVKITGSKFRRYASAKNFLDFFRFWLGFLQALFKIFWFMPSAVFSKGGPGALSVVAASQFYLIPLILHESDTIPGLTNKLSAKYARIIDLAFAAAAQHFGKTRARINILGNPVRQEILRKTPQEQAKGELGFKQNKPLVLVMGGSQGATRINDFVLANLEPLLLKFQIFHIVGKGNYDGHKNQYDFVAKNFSPLITANYKFVPYLDEKETTALDAADVVVSRAGAGAIFEIAAKGKPSILIPLPEAAGDHQRQNAYAYAENGAAVVIEQSNLLLSIFLGELERIFKNQDKQKLMSGAAKDFSAPDAAAKVAGHILEQWRR